MIDTQAIRERWNAVVSKLDERGRQVFAAGEVQATGWGGPESGVADYRACADCVSTKLGETRWLLVASEDYLRFAKPLSAPQDLTSHACILYTGRDAPRRWIFEGPGGARAGIDVAGNQRRCRVSV